MFISLCISEILFWSFYGSGVFQSTVSGAIKWAAGHICLKFREGLRMETFKSGGYYKDQSRDVDDISKVECRLES